MYEMMIGYPPFFSDDPVTTCHKIVNWKQYYEYPEKVGVCLASHSRHSHSGIHQNLNLLVQ